jgi:hypothetical protein
VAEHQTFPQAAATAGFKEARSVSHLVERFNRQGLAALLIASGRGRKPTYTSEQRARILEEVRREPDREKDQTATWSLLLLRNALRKRDLSQIATAVFTTIGPEALLSEELQITEEGTRASLRAMLLAVQLGNHSWEYTDSRRAVLHVDHIPRLLRAIY